MKKYRSHSLCEWSLSYIRILIGCCYFAFIRWYQSEEIILQSFSLIANFASIRHVELIASSASCIYLRMTSTQAPYHSSCRLLLMNNNNFDNSATPVRKRDRQREQAIALVFVRLVLLPSVYAVRALNMCFICLAFLCHRHGALIICFYHYFV